MPSVVLILSGAEHRILIRKGIALHLIFAQSQLIQIGDSVIKLLQITLIGLLSCRLGIGIAIATRERSSLSHSIHHRLLALEHILILILLIKSIAVHIVLKGLSVQNLIHELIQLSLPCRLIFPRLLRHVVMEHLLCLRYGVALLISRRGRLCRLCGSRYRLLRCTARCGACSFGIRRAAFQSRPRLRTDNAVRSEAILLLIVLDRLLCIVPEDAVLIELIAVLIQPLLQIRYICARGSVTELSLIRHVDSSYK